MKAMIILAAALSLDACATAPIGGSAVRTDGLARLNEATRVGPLVITLQAVVEDTCCLINARCVWAGRLIVETRIDGAGWREAANLTLGERYRTHGTALAWVSGEPGTIAGSPPSPPASLFGFEPR